MLNADDEVLIRFSEPDQPPHGGFPFGVTIALKKPKDNSANLSTQQWIKNTFSKEFPIKTETVIISNIESIKVTSEWEGLNIDVFIPYKNKMYSLYSESFITEDSTVSYSYNYKKTFDQILSTFRFLYKNQTIDTSNWNLYNGQFFSFKYPNSWKLDSDSNSIFSRLTTSRPTTKKTVGDLSSGIGWVDIIVYDESLDKIIARYSEKKESIVIGGKSAIKITGYTGIAGSVYFVNVVVNNGVKTVTLSLSTQDEDLKTQFTQEFNQILSTFKFLDENQDNP